MNHVKLVSITSSADHLYGIDEAGLVWARPLGTFGEWSQLDPPRPLSPPARVLYLIERKNSGTPYAQENGLRSGRPEIPAPQG